MPNIWIFLRNILITYLPVSDVTGKYDYEKKIKSRKPSICTAMHKSTSANKTTACSSHFLKQL